MTESAAVIPPQDLGAEEHVLGAILLNSTVLDQFADTLEPDDFYMRKHGAIYKAARDMHLRGDKVDAITLADELDVKGHLERVGGRARVNELAATATSTGNAKHHARIIREHAQLRRLIRTGQEIAQLGYDRPADTDTLIDQAERKVLQIATIRQDDTITTFDQALQGAFQQLTRMHESGRDLLGLSTGLRELDLLTSGLQAGNLVIVAARPSMGKSSLAIGLATHAAIREETPVGIFSLEMSQTEIAQRAISIEANIPLQKVRGGQKASPDEWMTISRATNDLANARIYLDVSSPTAHQIRATARRLCLKEHAGLLIIDYLQLITPADKAENQNLAVAAHTRELKRVAVDLQVPVVLLSQLNRNLEGRADKTPVLSDLRDSGAIEQDADIVIFVHREHAYDKDADPNIADLVVAKNRNGQTGTATVRWDPNRARFHNPGSRHLHAV